MALRAGVENLDVVEGGGFGQTGDRHALRVRPRVAARGQNDADGRSRIPVESNLVEPAVAGGEQDIEQVILESQQDRLRFGVAEAAVEFEHLGPGRGQHQTGVQHTAIRRVVAPQRVDNWHENVTLDRDQDFFRGHRGGAVGAHAAGVGSGVALADRLVVLGRFEHVDRSAVDQGQDREFRPLQAFFDDDGGSGLAERAILHDGFEGEQPLGRSLANHDAFSGGQPDRFDHQSLVARCHVVAGGFEILEDAPFGGRDRVLTAERFGVGLVPFDASGRFVRPEDLSSGRLEPVDDSRTERRLGPHDGQGDVVFFGHGEQAVDVAVGHVEIPCDLRGAGVSGGTKELFYAR